MGAQGLVAGQKFQVVASCSGDEPCVQVLQDRRETHADYTLDFDLLMTEIGSFLEERDREASRSFISRSTVAERCYAVLGSVSLEYG